MQRKWGVPKMPYNEKISIIMPAYNAEKTIERAIESVQRQTYTNWQLVIVNDGSKDATQTIIEQKCATDDRIESYTINNSGPAEARNYALERTNGKWIAFCDADDWLADNALFSMIDAVRNFSSQLGVCYYTAPSGEQVESLSKTETIKQFLVNSEFGGYLWNKIFLKDIIEKYNIKFEKSIYICEDLLFVIQYTSHIRGCVIIPQKLYNYDVQPDGLTSSHFSMKKVTQLDALEKIIEVLNDDADALNAEISKRLLVEKTIFIRRDAMKSLKSGVLQKRSPEYKYIKEKANRICRRYIKEYLKEEDFPKKFKVMLLLYCFI